MARREGQLQAGPRRRARLFLSIPKTQSFRLRSPCQANRREKRGRPEPDDAAPKPKAAAHKYCQGFNDTQCAFGSRGERARPHGPARCLFCDPERLEQALGDPARAVATRKRFARLSPETQEVALGRVREVGYRNWLAAVQVQPEAEAEDRHCRGFNDIPCFFGPEGEPARPNGPARCLFCDPERLQEALEVPARAAAARRRLAQLNPEAQAAALGRVLRPEHRDWLAAGRGPNSKTASAAIPAKTITDQGAPMLTNSSTWIPSVATRTWRRCAWQVASRRR